jgi:4-alpha-glucanotransferase
MCGMPLADDLIRLADAAGVATSYQDYRGEHTDVSEESVVAALHALGIAATDPAAALDELAAVPWRRALPPVTVVRGGGTLDVRCTGPVDLTVLLEDGGSVLVPVTGPVVAERDGVQLRQVPLPELPLGWHRVRAGAEEAVLVVAPASIGVPPGRTWGWMAQLYALRSEGSWGMGDYADLRTLVERTAADGGGVVLVNPLHAETPVAPVNPSPYSPSSRRFRSFLGLRIDRIPEAAGRDLDALRPSTDPDRVPRDPVFAAKLAALEQLWPGRREAELAAFRAEQGEPLEGFALFCALAEAYGLPWRAWPEELRHPAGLGIAEARERFADRVGFWCWVQLLVDEQLAAVGAAAEGMAIGVLHDLAVGVDAGGADAWALQDSLALHTTVGAPPDLLNQLGQDWGLPPWRPDRLREHAYAPYRDLVRGVLRHAGGIRIDHVMGLFRLWWVPPGRPASEGTYVAYDAEAMLGVLALEAVRAGAVVVGEDLGTVEPRVETTLAAADVLGSDVLWFQEGEPSSWRALAAASVTTHDLPTAAGFLAEEHVRVRAELGQLAVPVDEERARVGAERAALVAMLERTGLLAACDGDVVLALHAAVAASPARVVLAALGDAVGDLRQPNLPGTIDEYPNWRLPVADGTGRVLRLEELLAHPGVARLAALLRERVR